MNIVVTGATGLIGKKLIVSLMKEGHKVIALVRTPEKLTELPENQVIKWSHLEVPKPEIFRNCEVVIHLAGEGVADRLWTRERKIKLRESRINSTQNLAKAISQLSESDRPKTFICGSAIGIYEQSFEAQDEASSHGTDFLAQLCKDWEHEANEIQKQSLRVVTLRTGLVLAREGGLLSKSAPVVLGSGKQWMSWIHIDDVVRAILFSVNNTSVKGPINLTSPHPVSNSEFTHLFSMIKGFPLSAKAPEVILKLVLGEMSQAVLSNQKVLPKKLLDLGFKFSFDDLRSAFKDLMIDRPFTENTYSVKQFVPLQRSQVFSFFSKAENLETLTPPWLNFHIVGKSTPEVNKETLIDYKLKIHGVPVKWRTLIKEWNPDDSFVDFQLKGPYKKWHHLHSFDSVPGGTLISDDVTFEIPGWYFGKLLLPLIRKDVETIFNYRMKKIKELYSTNNLN